ncbi:hypothetical protein G5T42_08160 [Microbacterium sp. 4R-513]|uniref:hypothetical protein n=1 Tax=Microbacterium sp. 4R-513 TaxID=2567934 RepID=UPI0013E1C087|nr:hypothetical protein [Microbacterium sp. 4R-513]QIG39459.1 hypothetical protein G5T42_08160 [Microbacterium sp. 4R-513]
MKRRHAKQLISEEEQIARYAYVLGNVPAAIADRGYAAAFRRLAAPQQERLLSGMREQLPAGLAEVASDDPDSFATLMRNLHARSAIVTAPGAGALAVAFVTSPPIVAYFTTGAGSVAIDQHPPWLHELAGHETAPIDAGGNRSFNGPQRWV